MTKDAGEPTALYLLYSADDQLLYVGTTTNTRRRWKQHAADKDWWPQVVYADVAWHDSRAEAELREQQVIEEECPHFNRTMAPWRVPISTAMQREWREARDALTAAVVAALDAGISLDVAARASGWSPCYITRMRRSAPAGS